MVEGVRIEYYNGKLPLDGYEGPLENAPPSGVVFIYVWRSTRDIPPEFLHMVGYDHYIVKVDGEPWLVGGWYCDDTPPSLYEWYPGKMEQMPFHIPENSHIFHGVYVPPPHSIELGLEDENNPTVNSDCEGC